MRLLRHPLAQAALVAALTGVLFAAGLATSPPHLTHDEIKFSFQAKSIAETGRDINGRLLPVYFVEPGFSVGRDPLCIYVTAAVLRVLPYGERSIRFATVLVGAGGVGLLYLLGLRLFRSAWIALAVAALMALSPTYYIHSRLALSVLYPVPFTVLWLLLLHDYLSARRRATALATGMVLGAGIYSYLAAAIMMPLYLLATAVVLWQNDDRTALRRVAAGFAIMMVPIVLWQAVEPNRYANIVTAYRLFEEQPGVQPDPGAPAEGSPVQRRIDTFWAAFNPGSLFFSGESSLQISTRQVGSLLTPVAILLLVGLRATFQRPNVIPAWLWVFGLLTAPLPAVIMADVEIRRWLVVVPFVAIIAGFGIERLSRGRPRHRAVLAVLLSLCAVQFAFFAADYFDAYRERSSPWFGGNIRAAFARVLEDAATDAPSRVYISSDIPWVDAYWRFYTMVAEQEALMQRTEFVPPRSRELPAAVPGAVLVLPAGDDATAERLKSAGWDEVEVIADLDGSPSLAVVRASP